MGNKKVSYSNRKSRRKLCKKMIQMKKVKSIAKANNQDFIQIQQKNQMDDNNFPLSTNEVVVKAEPDELLLENYTENFGLQCSNANSSSSINDKSDQNKSLEEHSYFKSELTNLTREQKNLGMQTTVEKDVTIKIEQNDEIGCRAWFPCTTENNEKDDLDMNAHQNDVYQSHPIKNEQGDEIECSDWFLNIEKNNEKNVSDEHTSQNQTANQSEKESKSYSLTPNLNVLKKVPVSKSRKNRTKKKSKRMLCKKMRMIKMAKNAKKKEETVNNQQDENEYVECIEFIEIEVEEK